MSARDELAELLAKTDGQVPEGLSDRFYGRAAEALLAAGYRKPRTITTAEELDALPDGVLVEASGDYLDDGGFSDCWIRPLPAYITGGSGQRAWEVLIYLDGGAHNITHADRIKFPATVLYDPTTPGLTAHQEGTR